MKTSISKKYPHYCLYVYLIIWTFLAIKPVSRFDWFLENILPFVFVPILVFTYKKFKFSNASYTLITIFLLVHAVGSHYTYSQTPFFSELFSQKLTRDHYDRLAHFSFGLLMVYPLGEFLTRFIILKGFWSWIIPLGILIAFSALYELMEWGIAAIVAPHYANAWLGIQGDEFDAQKDMLLAAIGALITICVIKISPFAKFFRSKW